VKDGVDQTAFLDQHAAKAGTLRLDGARIPVGPAPMTQRSKVSIEIDCSLPDFLTSTRSDLTIHIEIEFHFQFQNASIAMTIRRRLLRVVRKLHIDGLSAALYFMLIATTGVGSIIARGYGWKSTPSRVVGCPQINRPDDGKDGVRADIAVADLHSGLIFEKLASRSWISSPRYGSSPSFSESPCCAATVNALLGIKKEIHWVGPLLSNRDSARTTRRAKSQKGARWRGTRKVMSSMRAGARISLIYDMSSSSIFCRFSSRDRRQRLEGRRLHHRPHGASP